MISKLKKIIYDNHFFLIKEMIATFESFFEKAFLNHFYKKVVYDKF
jgi:hypothetical protein